MVKYFYKYIVASLIGFFSYLSFVWINTFLIWFGYPHATPILFGILIGIVVFSFFYVNIEE